MHNTTSDNASTETLATSEVKATPVFTPETDRTIYGEIFAGIRPESDLALVSPEFIKERRANFKNLSASVSSTLKATEVKINAKEQAEIKSVLDLVASLASTKVVIAYGPDGKESIELSLEDALKGHEGKIKAAVKGTKGTENEEYVERDHTFRVTAARMTRIKNMAERLFKTLRNEDINEVKPKA